MDTKTVRDVIGEPESWPNFMRIEWQRPQDMRGATISEVFASGDQLAIQTKGAVCGATLSTFTVNDEELRDRLMHILKPDLSVYEAVAAAI